MPRSLVGDAGTVIVQCSPSAVLVRVVLVSCVPIFMVLCTPVPVRLRLVAVVAPKDQDLYNTFDNTCG